MTVLPALPWSSRCVKYLLFIFNLLFVITGIIILSVGATVHGVYGDYKDFLDDGYMSTSAFLIAIGFIIFFIAFFGCCGAIKENFCMILTFSSLLIIIFIFELAGGISGYVLRNRTYEFIETGLHEAMKKYRVNNETTKAWDLLQTTFNCCGVQNYTDWLDPYKAYPVSCCGPRYGDINVTLCMESSPDFHKESCVSAFGRFIQDHAVTLGGVAIGLAVIQAIGIIFSCHLSKQIKNNYNNM